MTRSPLDDDATVLVARPAAPRAKPGRRRFAVVVAVVAVVAALGAGGVLLYGRGAPPPATAPAATPAPAPSAPPAPVASIPAPAPSDTAAPPPARPPAAEIAFETADEATILGHAADKLTVFRFAAAPGVIVLDFPALAEQGDMLNRVAALIEKSGLPRDRVLNDAELAEAIRARGDTPATFYFGHDYPAAALVRFFSLADRDHIALDPAEETLRRLLRRLDWFTPGHAGGLISLSRAGADADITPGARATILHHELSHGAFFTDAGYAAYVRGFWRDKLTEKERAGMRGFLASEGYDETNEELMLNEMQAYMFYTYDPGYFDPGVIGMPAARRARLDALFRGAMPDFWLRAMPGTPLPVTASAACGSAKPCP